MPENRDRMTLKRIAELSKASVNTVSRALNKKDGVSQETRDRILQIAKEHNYRPNMLARSMRSATSSLIGVLVEDIDNPFFIRLVDGAQDEAYQSDMTVLIGNSEEEPGREAMWLDTFLSYRCAGVALCLVSPTEESLHSLSLEDTPYVLLDAPASRRLGCNHVSIDNENDIFTAVKFLIENGHQRIAMIGPEPKSGTEFERLAGYRRALEHYGLPIEESLVCQCADGSRAYSETRRLLDADHEKLTALLIAKEALALDVASAVMDMNLKVPDDISIVVYGDPEWARVFYPSITCIQRPVREMGREGIRMLLKQIAEGTGGAARRVVLHSRLVIRDSVRRIEPLQETSS